MIRPKGITVQVFSWAFCAVFLLSCHSNNNVVSSYGKRKYTKGWFLFRHGEAETKGSEGKDTTLTHKYTVVNPPADKNSVVVAPVKEQEQSLHKKHKHHHKDSTKTIVQSNSPESAVNKVDKSRTKEPPEPPDNIMMRLLVLIVVLTGLSILFTGLITPIAVWGITQNFMLGVGVIMTFIAYFISVNTTLGINPQDRGTHRQYNLGKPAWILSLWATIPMTLLYLAVKTSLRASLQILELTTVGLFFAGICILLSLLLATKALFVNDRHTGKAVFALFIDTFLITLGMLLLLG